MRDLYVNYDCDVACTNLFETLGRCLCHSAVPDSGTPLTSLHILALEGMLSILRGLAAVGGRGTAEGGAGPPTPAVGVDGGEAAAFAVGAPPDGRGDLSPLAATAALWPAAPPEMHRLSQMRAAEVLRQRKQLKRRLALASQRFNTDAKHWIEYAQARPLASPPRLRLHPAPLLVPVPAVAGARPASHARRRPVRRALPPRLPGPRQDAHRSLHLRARRREARLPDVRDTLVDVPAAGVPVLHAFLVLPQSRAQCLRRLVRLRRPPPRRRAAALPRVLPSAGRGSEDRAAHAGLRGARVDAGARPDAAPRHALRAGLQVGPPPCGAVRPSAEMHRDSAAATARSIIMLNTDLHNRTVKKANKMTLEQFLRNNR